MGNESHIRLVMDHHRTSAGLRRAIEAGWIATQESLPLIADSDPVEEAILLGTVTVRCISFDDFRIRSRPTVGKPGGKWENDWDANDYDVHLKSIGSKWAQVRQYGVTFKVLIEDIEHVFVSR